MDLVLWIGLTSEVSQVYFSAAGFSCHFFSEDNSYAEYFSEVVFKNVRLTRASLSFYAHLANIKYTFPKATHVPGPTDIDICGHLGKIQVKCAHAAILKRDSDIWRLNRDRNKRAQIHVLSGHLS